MDPQHDDIPDDLAHRRAMRDWAPGPPNAEEQARLDALKEKRERRDREHYQKLLAAGRKLREAEAREREGGSTRHSSTRKKGHKKHLSKDEGREHRKSGKHAGVVEGADKGHGNGGEEEERRRRRAARKAKRAKEHPEEAPRPSTSSATPEDKASRPSKHSKDRPRPSIGSRADEHPHDAAGPSTSAATRLSVETSGAPHPSSSKSVRLSVGSNEHHRDTSRPSSPAAARPSSTAADPRLSTLSDPSTHSSHETSHSHETTHSHETSDSRASEDVLTSAEAREELDRVFSMAPHLSALNRMGSRPSVLHRSASKSSLHVPATHGLARSDTSSSLARSNTTGSNLTRANTTGSNLASSNTAASTVGPPDTTSAHDSPYLIYRTPRPRPEGSISRFAARHSGEGYARSVTGGGGSAYGGSYAGSAYARSIAGGATYNGGYARSVTGGPAYHGGGGGGSTYSGSGAYARSCGTLLDHHGRASTDGAYNRPSYDAPARPALHRVYSESDFSLPPDPFDDEEPSITKRIVDKMRSISSLRTLAKKDKRF